MYQITFTEDELNLVWSILSNSNIAGKFAPTLSVIFNKLQDSVRYNAMQQQREKVMQEQAARQAAQPAETPNPAAEEKTETF